jgi:hypothetical protein
VSGFIVLIASLHAVARNEQQALTGAALVFTAAFGALVFLNYVLQTTFVPSLVSGYSEANRPLVSAFTMSNPKSLGWGLEMWGYGLLGVATWLVAPVFQGSRLERATYWAFAANGPASIVPAFLTARDPGWVLTVPGLVSFATWNLLVVVMTILALLVFRRRASSFQRAARGNWSPVTQRRTECCGQGSSPADLFQRGRPIERLGQGASRAASSRKC